MTMSFHTAYDIISEGIANEDHPGDITQRLHTAGAVAPDLPEPTTIENSEPTWELGTYFDDVTIFKGRVLIGVNSTIGVTLDLDEAEALAHATLAAVKHLKEQNR